MCADSQSSATFTCSAKSGLRPLKTGTICSVSNLDQSSWAESFILSMSKKRLLTPSVSALEARALRRTICQPHVESRTWIPASCLLLRNLLSFRLSSETQWKGSQKYVAFKCWPRLARNLLRLIYVLASVNGAYKSSMRQSLSSAFTPMCLPMTSQ